MTRQAALLVAVLAGFALFNVGGCMMSWGPPAPSRPTPTPMANCDLGEPSGWIYVEFAAGVSGERATEIIESLGVQRVPVEMIMSPIAFPIPKPGDGGYWEVVQVPPDEEEQFVAQFEQFPEVVDATAHWPGCPAL